MMGSKILTLSSSRGRFKEVAEYTNFIDNYTDDMEERRQDKRRGDDVESADRMCEKTTTQVRCARAEASDLV